MSQPALPLALDPPGKTPAYAWLLGFYDRNRWLMLGLLAVFYLVAFNGQWRPEPDSALYMVIGRNLAIGNGYTYHAVPNGLAWPGLPWLWAGLFKLFGTDTLWPHHLAMMLMGLGTLASFYRLVYLYAGRPHAVLLTCMAGMSIDLFRYSFELRNDVPFLFGVTAFLAGYEAWHRSSVSEPGRHPVRWYDIALGVGGLLIAVAMRPAMFVLLGALMVALVGSALRKTHRRLAIALIGLLVIGGGLFIMFDPREDAHYELQLLASLTERLTDGTMVENIRRLLMESTTEAAFGHELGDVLDITLGLLILGLGLGLAHKRLIWGALVAGTLMTLLIHLAVPRYLLPVLPLLALAWWNGISQINKRWHGIWGNLLFSLLLLLWVAPNFLKVCNFVWEQRQVPFVEHHDHGRYMPLQALAAKIHEETDRESWILISPKLGRIMTWYSHRRVSEVPETPPLSSDNMPRFIVLPMDAEMAAMLERDDMVAGPLIAAIPGKEHQPSYSLHRLVPAERAP